MIRLLLSALAAAASAQAADGAALARGAAAANAPEVVVDQRATEIRLGTGRAPRTAFFFVWTLRQEAGLDS